MCENYLLFIDDVTTNTMYIKYFSSGKNTSMAMWQLEEDVIIKEQATSYMYGKDGTKRGKVLPTAKS